MKVAIYKNFETEYEIVALHREFNYFTGKEEFKPSYMGKNYKSEKAALKAIKKNGCEYIESENLDFTR